MRAVTRHAFPRQRGGLERLGHGRRWGARTQGHPGLSVSKRPGPGRAPPGHHRHSSLASPTCSGRLARPARTCCLILRGPLGAAPGTPSGPRSHAPRVVPALPSPRAPSGLRHKRDFRGLQARDREAEDPKASQTRTAAAGTPPPGLTLTRGPATPSPRGCPPRAAASPPAGPGTPLRPGPPVARGRQPQARMRLPYSGPPRAVAGSRPPPGPALRLTSRPGHSSVLRTRTAGHAGRFRGAGRT